MSERSHRRERLWQRLRAPCDGAGLAFWRVAFGAIMVWEVGEYFAHGWITGSYIDPSFYFSFYGFDWVRPWPGDWMYLHFGTLGAAALCVAVGLFYRVAATVLLVTFTYVYLLDQTYYLNHFYLIVLISALMIFVPAHRCFSLDAIRSGVRPARVTVPAWSMYLLRGQLSLVYFFAGVAKINADWLRGEPMRMWLADRTDVPVVGRWFTEEPVVHLFSYGGLALDLLAAPALLWRRTRPFAAVAVIGFHLMNTQLFVIGIFPWMMIAATTLFFEPDWPRRVAGWSRRRLGQAGTAAITRAARVAAEGLRALFGPVGAEGDGSGRGETAAGLDAASRAAFRPGRLGVAALALAAAWFAVQVFMPLRHWLYPGVVHWTEEGHRYAWHMKLRDKRATSIAIRVTDPATGASRLIDPRRELTRRQIKTMAYEPEMLVLYSRWLADRYERAGHRRPEVRIRTLVSLNGRRAQLLVDPSVDLASQRRRLFSAASYILPLEPPRYR